MSKIIGNMSTIIVCDKCGKQEGQTMLHSSKAVPGNAPSICCVSIFGLNGNPSHAFFYELCLNCREEFATVCKSFGLIEVKV